MTQTLDNPTAAQDETVGGRDLTLLDAAVLALPFDAPIERVAAVRNAVKFAAEECRRIGKLLDERLVERITETGQDLVLSPTCRLYVAYPKTTKERDRTAVIDALLAAAGGDLAVIERCLVSGPFKVGAVRGELERAGMAERFDTLFETTANPDLKEGKPVKKLIEANPLFGR